MSNFGFIRTEWPSVFSDCARAESYVFSDPRTACIYARRSIEQLVTHLYAVLDIPTPYRDDLSARINDSEFKSVAGHVIHQKLNLIRNLGNTAVHKETPVDTNASIKALNELYLIVIWAAFNHSPIPNSPDVRHR